VSEISVLFVKKMIDQAGPDCDPEMLYAVAGVTESAAANPAVMISADAYYTLLETIASNEEGDIRFHIGTSSSMKCEEYGAAGLAFKSAPTLRQSFSRMDRYSKLFNTASAFALADKGETVWWTHHRTEPARAGLHLSNEGALATFVTLCREATSPDFAPMSVQFRHQPLGSERALEEYLRAPVTFGADVDTIVFSASVIDKPNTIGDSSIWSFFSNFMDEKIPDAEGSDTLEREVIQEIAHRLSDGIPPLGEVASSLGMGSRTLQRRVSERGTTYQTLVDKARRDLAQELLSRPKYSLADVAFLTGFSEQSSFTRAFKRWSGQTPKTYRISALSHG
jgi:AraC-like DNA-binding protein